MKIERKSHGIDEGDVFYVEPRRGGTLTKGATTRRNFRRFIPFVLTAILASAGTFGVVKYAEPEHFGLTFALQAAKGRVALTQTQLRDLVVGEGLVVYWLGPEVGARYTLVSVNKNQNYIRYLPGGVGLSDAGANFRVVGTYETKDAFLVTQNQGKGANSVGFINSDGNSVYYNTARPLSVYVGLKNTDDQIELFNPIAGQALNDAKTQGLIQRIS